MVGYGGAKAPPCIEKVDKMRRYIIKRLMLGVVILFGIILITFTLTQVLPADPAQKWVGDKATEEQIEAARKALGLDDPLPKQFLNYVIKLLHGNLGYSFQTHRMVTDELKEAIPATMELIIMAIIVGIIIGITFGVYSAKYKGRLADHIIRFINIGGISLPSFWTALALQIVFYGILHILPLGGRLSTDITVLYNIPHITGMIIFDSLITGNWIILKDALVHIILPTIPLCLYPAGVVARMTRSSLLEVLGEDYIMAERSYGIKESFILWHYALKNTMGATVTVVALTIGYMLTSTFLIESIFSWPGIGKYISDAIMSLDYPAIMGVTLFSAVMYLLLNLIADLIIAMDPRIRV